LTLDTHTKTPTIKQTI